MLLVRIMVFELFFTVPILLVLLILFSKIGFLIWILFLSFLWISFYWKGGGLFLLLGKINLGKRVLQGEMYHLFHHLCYTLQLVPPELYLTSMNCGANALLIRGGKRDCYFLLIDNRISKLLSIQEMEIFLIHQLIKLKRGHIFSLELHTHYATMLLTLVQWSIRLIAKSRKSSKLIWWLATLFGLCCNWYLELYLWITGGPILHRSKHLYGSCQLVEGNDFWKSVEDLMSKLRRFNESIDSEYPLGGLYSLVGPYKHEE